MVVAVVLVVVAAVVDTADVAPAVTDTVAATVLAPPGTGIPPAPPAEGCVVVGCELLAPVAGVAGAVGISLAPCASLRLSTQ